MAIFNVTSTAELYEALSNATGGDEIRLASGDYGKVDIRGLSFNSDVTITSADPNAPATISELRINNSSNITLSNLEFDYDYASGDALFYNPFSISGSSNITIRDSVFDGDVVSGTGDPAADGYPSGKGLVVKGSTGVSIENNEFKTFWKGLTIESSQDSIVTGNDVHSIRSDGMNFINVDGLLIENNYIHDFDGSIYSSDHRDMIQFWTANGGTNQNVTIRNNTLDIGDGTFTQSIFMSGTASNLVVDGNTIYNSHSHGITLPTTDGLVVTNNTLLFAEQSDGQAISRSGQLITGDWATPQINLDSGSKNVTVDSNVTMSINGLQSGWNASNNVLIGPDDYANEFTGESLSSTAGAHNYVPKAGGLIDTSGAGAFNISAQDGPTSSTDTSTPADTSGTTDTSGATDSGASDGTTGDTSGTSDTGSTTNSGGSTPDDSTTATGETDANLSLPVIDDYVLDFAALTDENLYRDANVSGDGTETVLVLDGSGDHVRLGRLEEFETSDQVTFSVDFQRDSATDGDGVLVWNHKKFGLSVDDDGLNLKVGTADGKFTKFSLDGLGLDDTEEHSVRVILDAETDHLQVVLDGEVVFDETETDFEIVDAGGREWGWDLGARWRLPTLDGEISDFRVDDTAIFIDDAVVVDDFSGGLV